MTEKHPIAIDVLDPRPAHYIKWFNNYSIVLATVSLNQGYKLGFQDSLSIAPIHIPINRLVHKSLLSPLEILIEPDDYGFLARTPDLPLYGYGEDRMEAIDMLKREIESLYEDLMEDDNFSDEYLRIKDFLSKKIKAENIT